MAKNLQAKLPPSDTIRIFDINKAAAEKLAGEMKSSQAGGAVVEVAQDVSEASKDAVSHNFHLCSAFVSWAHSSFTSPK